MLSGSTGNEKKNAAVLPVSYNEQRLGFIV
jgi:hypothetical protein